ncbi:hypothetical protein HYPSUDRAFT_204140 [Hypholoma sublateritium FD-334 SS-4]|uniref:Uncharacterized protein n=1 Tax=Hypholoma sublateritium (strain FD-334 SS-4) TaxID=945553 RepID=A0A0D2NLU8_HYPSF|nr:hypothetical protein HYPSUDRAFT_208712 [Hypholoma sublateritium FD-334 SS-4]KJA19879.1 hypothetical protein HYPSUDRAFT_204140 [Hypholoma sublateritium FD-334 SS-4]
MLGDENIPFHARNVAGIGLKNARTARVRGQSKHKIKQDPLMTLGFPNVKAGSFTSQAVSTVELPQGQWPELIESLLHFVHSPADTNLRHPILTSVIYGVRKEERSPEVHAAIQLQACDHDVRLSSLAIPFIVLISDRASDEHRGHDLPRRGSLGQSNRARNGANVQHQQTESASSPDTLGTAPWPPSESQGSHTPSNSSRGSVAFRHTEYEREHGGARSAAPAAATQHAVDAQRMPRRRRSIWRSARRICAVKALPERPNPLAAFAYRPAQPVYADCGYVDPPVQYDISAKTQTTEQQLLEMDMDAPMPTLPSGQAYSKRCRGWNERIESAVEEDTAARSPLNLWALALALPSVEVETGMETNDGLLPPQAQDENMKSASAPRARTIESSWRLCR